ncbi:MAG: amidohydrolase family protein [Kiritimatiellae bacterium]|nr:amidohydrolase family protein [Kiritimatiellia bacterium]
MIIDYVASLGSFAFRHVPDSDAPGLLRLMDGEAIDLALVSSLESVMYRNVQQGNLLLAERIAPHSDRFIGAAVINPAYAAAADDARYCLESLGMKAIRLYPSYHGYALDDSRVADVVSVARGTHVPVSIAMRVEDERQRHWLIDPPAVASDSVARLLTVFPDVAFVIERGSFEELAALGTAAPQATNWSADMSGRFLSGPPGSTPAGRHLKRLLATLGAARLVFGTDMPLQYPRVARLKLDSLELDATSRGQIAGGNAARLLGLSREAASTRCPTGAVSR